MKLLRILAAVLTAFLAGSVAALVAVEARAQGSSALDRDPGSGRPYNVLFIIIDDHGFRLQDVLNADSPVPTPNIRRLAERGTWFSHAYCDVPTCCPSRTAFLTGVHGARSGVYYNNQAYRRADTWISHVETLPLHFKNHGYLTAGYGKIAHNRFLEDDIGDYTPGYYKMLNRPADVTWTDAKLRTQIIPGSETKLWAAGWSWGELPDEWDRDDPHKLDQDTEEANRTIAILQQSQDRPFFVACGFWKPHVPWIVPKRYYERFPLDQITIPPGYKADDLEDVPMVARWLATHRGEHEYIVSHGLWKKCLQAYYASISYVDEQLGRVLDGLDAGPNRDNTIIVFADDNGWHTGEKNHWSKFFLSELACQVDFAIAVPGMKPQVVDTPVSLIDIYPTLAHLCRLGAPSTHQLDGVDLTPILSGATTDRGAPVLSSFGQGCDSIRDDRFRYTRYRDGSEELYDHDHDQWEWTNLANDPRFADVKLRLAAYLPKSDAPSVRAAPGGPQHDSNSWDDEVFTGKWPDTGKDDSGD